MKYDNSKMSALGIKNFKRELTGLAYPLSHVRPIDPKIESLDNPATFNDRFNQLGESIRYAIYAAGDIAIRDRRYLATFLSNYTNPMIDVSKTYEVMDRHLSRPNWEDNGKLIEFAQDDPRVEYNVDSLSRINFAASYTWVFQNGLLMDEENYDIFNTAYGVKCYIKRAILSDNDEITIKVNRIYNTKKDYVYHKIRKEAKNGYMLFVPVSDLGTFYHHKYVSVYTKETLNGVTFFRRIPETEYSCDTDVTGKSIKIDIFNYSFAKDSELFIFNNLRYWTTRRSSKLGHVYSNEIDITETLVDGSAFPIPFSTVEDFDVFFNGFHLTAGKHFTLIKGGNEFSTYKIKLLSQAKEVLEGKDVTEDFDIRVFKNEAVSEDQDVVIVREDVMQNQGLISVTDELKVLPITPTLGHNFLNGRALSNTFFTSKNRHIMLLDVTKAKSLNDFEHRTRVVSTLDLDAILRLTIDNYSEFDIVTEYIGLDNITSVIYKDLPKVKIDPSQKSLEDTYPAFEWYDRETAAVEQLRVITDYYYRHKMEKDLLLDANKLTEEHGYPIEIINSMLVLDSNMKQSKVYVLDTNHFFQTRPVPEGVIE